VQLVPVLTAAFQDPAAPLAELAQIETTAQALMAAVSPFFKLILEHCLRTCHKQRALLTKEPAPAPAQPLPDITDEKSFVRALSESFRVVPSATQSASLFVTLAKSHVVRTMGPQPVVKYVEELGKLVESALVEKTSALLSQHYVKNWAAYKERAEQAMAQALDAAGSHPTLKALAAALNQAFPLHPKKHIASDAARDIFVGCALCPGLRRR
jgi:hypothetical protein